VNASALESVIGPFNDQVAALELANLDSVRAVLPFGAAGADSCAARGNSAPRGGDTPWEEIEVWCCPCCCCLDTFFKLCDRIITTLAVVHVVLLPPFSYITCICIQIELCPDLDVCISSS
jgi:hypothetical protein